MNDAVFATALQLASAIRSRTLSAVELIGMHLQQIERQNPVLNAVVTLDAERALERARQADTAVVRGENWGPLHGVPITLKDCHATAGIRTTSGHLARGAYVPKSDGTVAARLKAAGAILLGKTNTPPLTLGLQTDNPLFGRTNNPWDPHRTSGGSSGGAAAAVAAGLSPLDIGSDTTASLRWPAHCCGVYALKPTARRVSLAGFLPDPAGSPRIDRHLTVLGPVARSIDDLGLAFRLLRGPDGIDTELAPITEEACPTPDLQTLSLAWMEELPGVPVGSSIRQAIRHVAADLEARSAKVERTTPPWDVEELTAAWREFGMAFLGLAAHYWPVRPMSVPETSLADWTTLLDRRDRFVLQLERFFDDWDALLCPVAMTTAFPHCDPGEPLTVDEQAADYDLIDAYCYPFSYTGHPVVVMPVARDTLSLPIGLQLVGKRWGDERLLAVARGVAESLPGFQPPPPV